MVRHTLGRMRLPREPIDPSYAAILSRNPFPCHRPQPLLTPFSLEIERGHVITFALVINVTHYQNHNYSKSSQSTHTQLSLSFSRHPTRKIRSFLFVMKFSFLTDEARTKSVRMATTSFSFEFLKEAARHTRIAG